MNLDFDAVIVGAGPAGLSAALMLGRCRRSVLVCDSGRYRNARATAMHGFLSRDGIPPAELRRVARDQLDRYGVQVRPCTVTAIHRTGPRFAVVLADNSTVHGRRILLATGVEDRLPEIENIERFYGTSVHHCPYCDAWEHRDQPMAAFGKGRSAFGLALSLKTWTEDVALCTGGPYRFSKDDRRTLAALGIAVRTGRLLRLEGHKGALERLVFDTGEPLARRALFFNTGQHQSCRLGGILGCEFTRRGAIKTDKSERTSIPGIFAAGDCSRNVQWVVVAAAQGAIAAEQINIELQEEDRRRVLARAGA